MTSSLALREDFCFVCNSAPSNVTSRDVRRARTQTSLELGNAYRRARGFSSASFDDTLITFTAPRDLFGAKQPLSTGEIGGAPFQLNNRAQFPPLNNLYT